MAATASQVVTIIADDLTGACDTGCLFAGSGPVGVLAPLVLTGADSSLVTPVMTVDLSAGDSPTAACSRRSTPPCGARPAPS
jgi:hypothetical protein